jgi:hypothetical protein
MLQPFVLYVKIFCVYHRDEELDTIINMNELGGLNEIAVSPCPKCIELAVEDALAEKEEK